MTELRVFQLAKELGLHKQELVSRIHEMSLGLEGVNPMSALSQDEVNRIRSAITGTPVETAAPPKKKKRTRKKKTVEEAPVDPVSVDDIAPIVRSRSEESEEDSAPEEETIEPVVVAPVVSEPVVEAVEVPEPIIEEVPEPVVEEIPEPEVVVEPDPVPEPVVVAEPVVVEEKPATPTPPPSEPKTATVVEEPRRRDKPKGGAQVVGAMNQNVLLDRLAAEGKDFSPGPKRAAAGNQGGKSRGNNKGGINVSDSRRRTQSKRVVEGRDLYDGSKRNRRNRRGQQKTKAPQKTEITTAAEHKRNIRIEDAITVGDLAKQMGIKSGQVSLSLINMGMMANVNTMLDFDTAALIAEEFGYTIENVAFDIEQFYDTDADPEETLKPRPPVVTVMGHVDHGKTSLLDAMRSSSVAEGEAGGITQHIGAYTVQTSAGWITFLDTPGHEAFTALRARGAKATDIVVLVVAADDGVMPQTVEAINHSRAAGVPIIVAVNKIDKDGANPDRVKQALTEYELIPEEWGGSTLFVEVSALQNTNIDSLIEQIALQAELEELRANPERDAQGLVVEGQLDIGRGAVATLLVQRGTLKKGDILVSGQHYGRVRTMNNERGDSLDLAGPSTPVEITGLSGVPEAGEPFFVVADERDAKRITSNVQDQRKKEEMASRAKEGGVSLEDLSAMIKEGEIKELKVIIKGDVQGSIEALRDAFAKLGNDEVAVKAIHTAVGGITENDVNLAASSEKGAVIVGFNVRPDSRAAEMAEKYGVQVLTHSIIYDAIEQIRGLLEGLLSPVIEEEVVGRAEVRETFSAPKIGTIAGCYVLDGMIRRGGKARLIRDGVVIYDSEISSLRRFKDDVREVKNGFECGLSLLNYNDIKVGDVVEVYQLKEVAAILET